MRFAPITVKARDSRDIVLRSAEPKDAEAIIEYLKVTNGETPFLICEPEEIDLTVEEEEEILRRKAEKEKELVLVAFADGRHIGNCVLMSVGRSVRYAHRCRLAIALYKKYCGLGIGRLMLETVLEEAKKLGYEQAELEAASRNTGAIALYEKLGFRKYGTFPDSMKYKDGSYDDEVFMVKKL